MQSTMRSLGFHVFRCSSSLRFFLGQHGVGRDGRQRQRASAPCLGSKNVFCFASSRSKGSEKHFFWLAVPPKSAALARTVHLPLSGCFRLCVGGPSVRLDAVRSVMWCVTTVCVAVVVVIVAVRLFSRPPNENDAGFSRRQTVFK